MEFPSSSSSSRNKPIMFFKVYLPNHSSQQLQIPSAFVKRLNYIVPRKSAILSYGKQNWSVDVKEVGDTLVFQNGWSDFVCGNSLEAGDFLFFTYLGAGKFKVQIYGPSTCEKSNSTLKQCKVEREVEEIFSEDGSSSHEKEKKKCVKGKSNADKKHRVRSTPKYRIWNGDGIKNKVPVVSITSVHPRFQMCILRNYTSHGSLNVPMAFAKKYLKLGTKKEDVQLQVLEKSWPVTLTYYTNSRCCKISKGWLAFVKDNCIKLGDVCVFELLDLNDLTFKVSVF